MKQTAQRLLSLPLRFTQHLALSLPYSRHAKYRGLARKKMQETDRRGEECKWCESDMILNIFTHRTSVKVNNTEKNLTYQVHNYLYNILNYILLF